MEIHKHFHGAMVQKLLFHGPAHRRAAVPSGPLSYCFGITATSGKPSPKFPLGELEGQEPLPPSFVYHFSEFSTTKNQKSRHFPTFSKCPGWIEL